MSDQLFREAIRSKIHRFPQAATYPTGWTGPRTFAEIMDADADRFAVARIVEANYVSIVRRHVEATFGELYQPGTRWLDKFKRGQQAPALRLLAQYADNPPRDLRHPVAAGRAASDRGMAGVSVAEQ